MARPITIDPNTGRPLITPEAAGEVGDIQSALQKQRRREIMGALGAGFTAASGRAPSASGGQSEHQEKMDIMLRRTKLMEVWNKLSDLDLQSEEAEMVWSRQMQAGKVNTLGNLIEMYVGEYKANAGVNAAVGPAKINADVQKFLSYADTVQSSGWSANTNVNDAAISNSMTAIAGSGIFHLTSQKGSAPAGMESTGHSGGVYWAPDATGGSLVNILAGQLETHPSPIEKAVFLDQVRSLYGFDTIAGYAGADISDPAYSANERILIAAADTAKVAQADAQGVDDANLQAMSELQNTMDRSFGAYGDSDLKALITAHFNSLQKKPPQYRDGAVATPAPAADASPLQKKTWVERNSLGALTLAEDGNTIVGVDGQPTGEYASYTQSFGDIQDSPAEEARDNIRTWLQEMEEGKTANAREAKKKYMQGEFFQKYRKARPMLTEDQAFRALNRESRALRSMNKQMGVGMFDAALRTGVAEGMVKDVRKAQLRKLFKSAGDSGLMDRTSRTGAKGVVEPSGQPGAQLTQGARGPGDPVGGEAVSESQAQKYSDADSMMQAQLGVDEPEGQTRGGRAGAVMRELQELVDSGVIDQAQADSYMQESGLTEGQIPQKELLLTAPAANFDENMTGEQRAATMIRYMAGHGVNPGTLLKDDEESIVWVGEPDEGGNYIYEAKRDSTGEFSQVQILFSPRSKGGQIVRSTDTSPKLKRAWTGFLEEIQEYQPVWAKEREEAEVAKTDLGWRQEELKASGEDVHARLPSKEPVPSERGDFDKSTGEYAGEPGYDTGMLGPDPDVERPGQVMRAGPEDMTEAAGRRPETKVGRQVFEAQAEWMFDQGMFEAIPAFKGLSEEDAIKKFADAAVRKGSNPAKVLDGIERRWFDLNDPQKTISAQEYADTFLSLINASNPRVWATRYAKDIQMGGDPRGLGAQPGSIEGQVQEDVINPESTRRQAKRRYRAMVKPEGPLEIPGADPDVLKELREEEIGVDDLGLEEPEEVRRLSSGALRGGGLETTLPEAQHKLSEERIAVLEQMANREPPYEDISPERAALARQTVDQYKRVAQLDPEGRAYRGVARWVDPELYETPGTPREKAEMEAVRQAILSPAEQAEQTLWELPEEEEETWGPFGKMQKGVGKERRGLLGTGRRAWQAELEKTEGLDTYPADPMPSAPVGAPGSGRGYWEDTPRTVETDPEALRKGKPSLKQTGQPRRKAASPATETLRTARGEDRRKKRRTKKAKRQEIAAEE